MNKIPFVAAAGVSIVALVFTASIYMNVNNLKPMMLKEYVLRQTASGQKLVVLNKNAFGSLSLSDAQQNGSKLGAPTTPSFASGNEATRSAMSADAAFPEVGFGGGAVGMIAPYYNYQYNFTYAGDGFVIENTEMPVYRLILDSNVAKSMASSILDTPLGFLDLSGLSGVSVGNLSLTQGKDGYNIYMNFDQGRVSIDKIQNYPYLYKTMAVCDGPGCGDRPYEEPKYEQVADNGLIDKAEEFVSLFNIDKSMYGKPVVDKSFKKYNYDSSYVPRYQSVVYPLAFDGREAVESNGYANGMRINVDLADLTVQGASEILNPLFEQSNYELETDFARILKIAQKGGMNGMFYIYGAQAEGETLDLGTPEYVYMHQYDYADGYSSARELYLPALRFPIINIPKDRQIYQDYVIVPLAKEILDTYEKQGDGGSLPRPVPMMEGSAGGEVTFPETQVIKY